MTHETSQLPLSLLLKKDLPFATYRLPGSKKIQFVFQLERMIESNPFENLDTAEGFAVAEFNSYKTKRFYLIKPYRKTNEAFIDKEFIKKILALPDAENIFKENKEISEGQYLKMANKLIQELKKEKLKKVVLSRMIAFETGENFTAEKFFKLLETSYREAFVYIINLPGKGTWVGATPEVLLRINNEVGETVSLAGTKPIDKIDWTEKEIEEQKIVTDSIAETLMNCGINNFTQKGPETYSAGNIAHLKTVFRLPVSELKGKIGKLLKELHPTPAVCGLPKDEAFDLISKTEMHERRFYTGFIGPVNLDGKTDLFVNLRCAELGKNTINIYVGGGLTAASVAKDEWKETVRKSGTLLAVAKKLQTFAP
ncbi:MAG TPA: isochorismate synthase [Bacteroidales bacterium]